LDSTFSISKPGKAKTHTHKFYAVAHGRAPGIYTSWPITQAQVHGFSGALFQGFHDYSEAQHFLYIYATALPAKDRTYLKHVLSFPSMSNTTNVNVNFHSPTGATGATGATSVTGAAPSTSVFVPDSPATPSTHVSASSQASDSNTIDLSHDDDADEINASNETDDAISALINDDNLDDASYNSFDSASYDPTATRFYILLQVLHPKLTTILTNKPSKTSSLRLLHITNNVSQITSCFSKSVR
jgi:hypothetical protein